MTTGKCPFSQFDSVITSTLGLLNDCALELWLNITLEHKLNVPNSMALTATVLDSTDADRGATLYRYAAGGLARETVNCRVK